MASQKLNILNTSLSSGSDGDDTSDSDYDPNDKTTCIRVGDEYQTDLEPYEINKHVSKEIIEKEELLWAPNSKISDSDIFSYLSKANSKYSVSIEQALKTLCSNNYDTKLSLMKVKNIPNEKNDWSEEDKILFEQAFNYHGKNFLKIKQCLPDKSQACLVKFYYIWKKSKHHISLIDQQQNNKNVNDNDQNQSNENETDENNFNSVNKICYNCDLITSDLHSTTKGMLCLLCFKYYKSTSGLMRPDSLVTNEAKNSINNLSTEKFGNSFASQEHNIEKEFINKRVHNTKEAKNFQKSLRKPPKGIFLNYDELVSLCDYDQNLTFDMLDKKLLDLKREVCFYQI